MQLLRRSYYTVCGRLREVSLKRALAEQELFHLKNILSEAVPDISHQYSNFDVDSSYLQLKVRAQHAFQISLVQDAIRYCSYKSKQSVKVFDIGDSSGTHSIYIKKVNPHLNIECGSLSNDQEAVKKINAKGLKAIYGCVEKDNFKDLGVDLFLAFEVLEHSHNPILALRNLSEQTACKAFVFTVPYLSKSRVGLYHIRNNTLNEVNSEGTHIFELSPTDWKLLFQHSGWRVVKEQIYYQYPLKSYLKWTKKYWRNIDFEGFYGGVLVRDDQWKKLYKSW